MDITRFVSDRCQAVEFSGIRKFFDLAAAATDPIDLSIGQPDYDTDNAVKDAAIAAIRNGQNRYTPSAGLPELRKKIAAALTKEVPGWEPGVLITSGVSGGLMLALLALVNEGDEVIYPDPYFVSYRQLVRLINAKGVGCDTYPDFQMTAERIAPLITSKTRLLMVNSPGNPTGCLMSDADARAVAELARKHDLLLISDEIYNELCYDGDCPSPAKYAPERTILLRGYGKTYGVTGWRLGYMACDAALMDQLIKLQQYTFVCAPSPFQYATLTALETDVSHHRKDYTRKRDLVVKALSGTFEFAKPGGGFYIFPQAPKRFANATAFCEAAAKREVFVIPGGVFSQQDTHFRISYATSDEKLLKGCEILCQIARGEA